jgi:hypothetical protein
MRIHESNGSQEVQGRELRLTIVSYIKALSSLADNADWIIKAIDVWVMERLNDEGGLEYLVHLLLDSIHLLEEVAEHIDEGHN